MRATMAARRHVRPAGAPAGSRRELEATELRAARIMLAQEAGRTGDEPELRRLCSLAFGLRRALPAPREPEERLEFAAVLACEGILAGRIADVRRWLKEALPEALGEGGAGAGAAWDKLLFSGVVGAFLETVAADGPAGLRAARDRIRRLRESQPQFEPAYLKQRNGIRQAAALELVACYHMAKAVEAICTSALAAAPQDRPGELGFHAARALRAARDAGSAGLSTLFLWMGNAMEALLTSREA